jgi:ribonuclease P protein component
MDRLRQRADFLAVANGPRMNSAAFVVQSRARDDAGPVRVGFTVTKKVGTATERNRVRRRRRSTATSPPCSTISARRCIASIGSPRTFAAQAATRTE